MEYNINYRHGLRNTTVQKLSEKNRPVLSSINSSKMLNQKIVIGEVEQPVSIIPRSKVQQNHPLGLRHPNYQPLSGKTTQQKMNLRPRQPYAHKPPLITQPLNNQIDSNSSGYKTQPETITSGSIVTTSKPKTSTFSVYTDNTSDDENSDPSISPQKSTSSLSPNKQQQSHDKFVDYPLGREFALDIFNMLCMKEKSSKPENYIRRQKEISQEMRSILVDWLIEVTSSGNIYYCQESLPFAINYIDRFLTKMGVPKNKLQLLGIVCLMIASKMTDTLPPDVVQLVELTDKTYTQSQVKKMEIYILDALNFDLYPASPCGFFNHYLYYCCANPDIDETSIDDKKMYLRSYSGIFCQFLNELTLLDYHLSVTIRPSTKSLAIVLLFRLIVQTLLKQSHQATKLFPVDFFKKEPGLLQNVEKHGIISPELATFVQNDHIVDKKHELVQITKGIVRLWREVIDSSNYQNVLLKFCDTIYIRSFPDLAVLFTKCVPQEKHVDVIFE